MVEEFVDLVDIQGAVQKRGVPRSEVGQYNGLYMQIVIGVITDGQGRVLVHKRSKSKKVNPGDVDLVCGGVLAEESPEAACRRETTEETGVNLIDCKLVAQGLNEYGRYRYLLSGASNDEPHADNPEEVEVAWFEDVEVLEAMRESGELAFVDGFFEDIERVREFERREQDAETYSEVEKR